VYDVAQALDADFVAEQERLLEFRHASGPVRMVASPVRAGSHPTRPAPAMGENTAEVLKQAGYTPEQIDQLKSLGVI
jgi:crotonobetainyl-CoA:carnitine CoA-transferase CaiB-like acyl-CoA transferase